MAQPPHPGLILSPGPEGWWDSERVSCPRVLRGLNNTWNPRYYGRDAAFDRQINLPTGRCGLATSADGIHWDRVKGPLTMGAVFEPSPDPNRFDSTHVGVSDVTRIDGLYWMWYFGGGNDITVIGASTFKGLHMCSGCAISRDGINWTRLDGPYHGALLDRGEDTEFDALFAAWPQALPDESGWKLYYHTLSPDRTFLVGLAISSDGFGWNKLGQILGPGAPGSFDEKGIGTRQVIKINNEYTMFYEGVNNTGYNSIGLALSSDGIHWEKASTAPIFSPAPGNSGRWDAQAIGAPCVVPMDDGSYRMVLFRC